MKFPSIKKAERTGRGSFRLSRTQALVVDDPVAVVTARQLDAVMPALAEVEVATARGLHAFGFVAYEAAPAFDPALQVRPPGPLPLVWFGLYPAAHVKTEPVQPAGSTATPAVWAPDTSRREYERVLTRIHELIARGETYQVNYTTRLLAALSSRELEESFHYADAPFGARIETEDHLILSASPELFFERSGETITCRPMKGTAPRGKTWKEDEAQAQWLRHSAKNRAENVMIVDMVRNDLGRIARPGTVETVSLFDVERYPTLLQMTSTVTAQTQASLPELFQALFPCASVTGAPKVQTMKIIAALESTPRGVYTGCIGHVAPGGRAHFSVAIRTVTLDKRQSRAEYGTGGGIVWDSVAQQEYEECETKARVLTEPRPVFSLLETLLWLPDEGFWLLPGHLDRLEQSARYFGIPVSATGLVARLDGASSRFSSDPQRVRLLVDQYGEPTIESTPMPGFAPRRSPSDSLIWRVALASQPVSSGNIYLYHKTTARRVYEQAAAERPELDDVVLVNERGELTESTKANLVVLKEGGYFTPALDSGLLAGVYRDRLLRQGHLRETRLTPADLAEAEQLFLVNAVRGWVSAQLVGPH